MAITKSVQDNESKKFVESSAVSGQPAIAVVNPDGSNISGGSGGGSGTEYTEDAAAAANPVGPMSMARRKDTLDANEVSADGDNIALNATSKGELHVKDVDAVTSLQLLDDIVKAEDTAHASGDKGVMSLAVVNANFTSQAAEGDYVPFQADEFGRQFVIEDSAAAIKTSVQLIDDTIFTDDAAFTPGTSKTQSVGFLADESSTDSVDEGDIGIARMTLDRKQQVVSELEGDYIRSNGTQLLVKRSKISAASSGNNTLVAAVASKKIRVLSLALISNGAVDLYFDNATDGGIFGDSTNKVDLQQSTGFILPHNPHGWFQTGTNNEALRVNLSAAIAVAGSLTYVEV